MTTSDNFRLVDLALSEEKKTSFFIEKQFPAIYREEGRELIELVKAYYRFLEENEAQSVYNIRRIYDYRNIDSTLDRMLIFFKNKFMSGLFLDRDVRFVVKHILDLYRRKGSKEGIELFFRLFFDSESLVYFPSEDMLKPSTSLWKTGSFIQLYGITDTKVFNDIVNRKVFGDKSGSEAFVDAMYFINIDNHTIPILFLSSIKGRFQRFDVIFGDDPVKIYGKVYGSVREVSTDNRGNFTPDNAIGDIVEIRSSIGFGAKGRVTDVSEALSGQIEFEIVDGGFGYTDANTSIEISTQTVFFRDPDPTLQQQIPQFFVGEKVRQIKGTNTVIDGFVIGQRKTAVGIRLDYTTLEATTNPATYVLASRSPISTVDRIENITEIPLFVTEPNDTASAKVGPGCVVDTEEITIITDLISNFVDVPLNSLNYSAIPPADLAMSGTRVNGVIPTASTPLNVAFVPENFFIGTIAKLIDIDPGLDYVSDAFVLARENIISRFSIRNQVLRIIQAEGIVLFIGDIINQRKLIKTFEGNIIETLVRGRIVNTVGNELYVTQLTFESFITSKPIFKTGSDIPITVVSRSRDPASRPLGLNADINANVETVTGRIKEIEIIDSGFGYVNQANAQVFNNTRNERIGIVSDQPDCVVITNASDQGIAEGRWESFFSHINQEKVIQDSFFYQDYSYEITTDVSAEEYVEEYIDLVHPAGLKLFTKFGKTDDVLFEPRVRTIEVSSYVIDDASREFLSERNSSVTIENGFSYINSQFIPVSLLETAPVIIVDGDGGVIIRPTTDTTRITTDSTQITTDSA